MITTTAAAGTPLKHHRRRLVRGLTALTVGLLATGCGSSEPSSSSSSISATTTSTAEISPPSLTYAVQGNHAVGYREFTTTGAQQQPLTVRAWYPALRPDDTQPATITYTAPNKFDRQLLPVEHITSVGAALADGRPEPTDTPYPLVVFSHGYAISPIVFSVLVEHYASQGFIVLAPEHNETFDPSLTTFWKAIVDRPVDIQRTIDYAEDLNASGSSMAGLIDLDNIAVVGHSYGGYTALAAGGARFDFAAYRARCAALTAEDPRNFFCSPVVPMERDMATRAGLGAAPTDLWPSLGDPRVKAVISLAGDAYLFNERGLAELKVPMMAMGGTVDDGTPYEWGSKLTYDDAGSTDKTLITFPGAGHMLFVDPCANLPWVETFSYRDGFCLDAVWGTDRPLDIVKHYSTAFLRDNLNADDAARASLTGTQPDLDNVEYVTTAQP